MRPNNNRTLTWEEVTLDPVKRTGRFRLDRQKNVNRGINAYGRLARQLVDYLLSIRPRKARGVIHPNPATGKPYVDIRKQWDRLIAIASGILGYQLVDEKADFFTFRHSGATHIARRANDKEELMRVLNMMGDTTVEPPSLLQLRVRRRRGHHRHLPQYDPTANARRTPQHDPELTN